MLLKIIDFIFNLPKSFIINFILIVVQQQFEFLILITINLFVKHFIIIISLSIEFE